MDHSQFFDFSKFIIDVKNVRHFNEVIVLKDQIPGN